MPRGRSGRDSCLASGLFPPPEMQERGERDRRRRLLRPIPIHPHHDMMAEPLYMIAAITHPHPSPIETGEEQRSDQCSQSSELKTHHHVPLFLCVVRRDVVSLRFQPFIRNVASPPEPQQQQRLLAAEKELSYTVISADGEGASLHTTTQFVAVLQPSRSSFSDHQQQLFISGSVVCSSRSETSRGSRVQSVLVDGGRRARAARVQSKRDRSAFVHGSHAR